MFSGGEKSTQKALEALLRCIRIFKGRGMTEWVLRHGNHPHTTKHPSYMQVRYDMVKYLHLEVPISHNCLPLSKDLVSVLRGER